MTRRFRIIALALLFVGVVFFAAICTDQMMSPLASEAPRQDSPQVERLRKRSKAREVELLSRSTNPRPAEVSGSLFAGESQTSQDAIKRLFNSDPASAQFLTSAFNRWLLESPELARKLAFLMLEGSSISAGLSDVEKNWLPHELDLSLVWIHALPPGDLQSSLMNQLGRFYLEVDPVRALSILPASSPPERQAEFMIQVMHRWAEIDPQKAGQHLATMPAGPIRNAAEHAYLSQIIERSPAAAASYVANEMESESHAQGEAIRHVVTRWSHLDPAATAMWLESFPASALKLEMIGILMPTWAEKNPVAASSWSQAIPVSAEK